MLYYNTPPGSVLTAAEPQKGAESQAAAIVHAFARLGVGLSLVEEVTAPQLIAYHLNLSNLKDFHKVKRLLPTVAAALRADVVQTVSRMADVVLTVPRRKRQITPLERVINSPEFISDKSTLPAAVGVSSDNNPIIIDIAKMPHILIAGTTGSGKSVILNSIITSLLFKATPNRCRLLMIDLKRLELTPYNGLPHLLHPIATDYKAAFHIIKELFNLMRRRFIEFERLEIKNIYETSKPHVLLVVDELAELILTDDGGEVSDYLNRLAALGRAAGIHLILATQRPTRAVLPGLLAANIPGKIALKTASIRESVVILDHKGAERLTGCGDALVKLPDQVNEIRTQTAYTTAADVAAVVEWWRTKGTTTE